MEQETLSTTSDADPDETAIAAAQAEPDLPPPLRADSPLTSAITAFDDFMLRKGFRDNTMKAFRNDLKILVGFMDGSTLLHQIHTSDLEDFLDWLQHGRGKSCSAKTLARRITTLKVFFGWLHGVGVIGTDPAAPIIQQPARTPLPTILRDDEISRLQRAAQDFLFDRKKPDARPYLLVALLLQTGIKKSECANLLLSDFESDDVTAPAVHIRYADERQAHKNRRLPLDPSIIPVLQPVSGAVQARTLPVRMHPAQPGIRARRSRHPRRDQIDPGRLRDTALDQRIARLPSRSGRRTPAREDGPHQNLVARDA